MDSATLFIVFMTVYLGFIGMLAYTVLCGGSRRHEERFIGRVHVFLTQTLSESCQSWLGRVFCRGAQNPGQRAADAMERAMDFFEARVMPVIYLGLLVAGLATARAQIIPRLPEINPPGVDCPRSRLFCFGFPGAMLTVPPTTHSSALWVYAILAFGSWLQVFRADPGCVTEKSFELMRTAYDYDGILFVEGRECRTCKRPKLPRTKHDRAVGKCIMRYDHFCGWTGNAIGVYNTNRFLAFLTVHLAMLVHGAMLCAEIVWERMIVFIRGNYTYSPTNWKITRFSPVVAIAAEPMVTLFFIVLLVSIGVVGGFLGYHLYLVANNTTTAETFKWAPVNADCKDYRETHSQSFGDKLRQEAENEARATGQELQYVPPFRDDGLPVNIYDRGVFQNALEVMFPRKYLRLRAAGAKPKSQSTLSQMMQAKSD